MLSMSQPGITVVWAVLKAAQGAGTRLQPPQLISEEHLLPEEVRMSSSNLLRKFLSLVSVPLT